MTMIVRAPVDHVCRPGWMVSGGFLTIVQPWPRPGDVWRCDCGVEWVAGDAASNHATVGQRTVRAVEWDRRRLRRPRWWRR